MTDTTVTTPSTNEHVTSTPTVTSSGTYSIASAARVLGVSQYRIRKWIDSGEMKCWTWRKKHRYVNRDEIVRMKRQLKASESE